MSNARHLARKLRDSLDMGMEGHFMFMFLPE